MDDRKNAVFTITFLASIILIFTLVDFFHGARVYSETENRVLASKPRFSFEELWSGSYTSDYESYVTDQFVSRDKWILIKTTMDIWLQKNTINGVYLGSGGYLIEQHLPQDYTEEQVQSKLDLLECLVEEWDAVVMLAPTADNILMDRLPANAPVYDQTVLLDRVAELAGEGRYVDVFNALKEHKDEEIYYHTDHHWTSLGAYYGYLAWAETVGENPVLYNVAGLDTVSEDFLGTLHSKINLNWSADSIQYFPDSMKRLPQVTYDLQKTTSTFYEVSYLETKNKYGFFMDDNHALIEIDTGYTNGKTLFLIKDSYANCLIPLISPHYEKIYVVDLRYYNGRLFDLMGQYRPEGGMDVLVLYNCIHFLEDFNYY